MKQKEYIRVWDLFVRIFHWSLLLFVVIAFLSEDEKSAIHRYAGYITMGLISTRIVWGFIGTKYARFSSFICHPTKAVGYIIEVNKGSPQHHIGHNPAAGWMVIMLLFFLVVVGGTGQLAYQEEKANDLKKQRASYNFSIVQDAYADSGDEDEKDDEDEFWEEFHEVAASVLLTLIFLHICGALVSSKMHNENLVKSMITGLKEKRT